MQQCCNKNLGDLMMPYASFSKVSSSFGLRERLWNNAYIRIIRLGLIAAVTAWVSTGMTPVTEPHWVQLEHASHESLVERVDHAPLERDFMLQEILTVMLLASLFQASKDGCDYLRRLKIDIKSPFIKPAVGRPECTQ